MTLFYFGKSRVFLPKMIGAFVLVLAVLMFVVSSGRMFDAWDAMSKYPDCLESIGSETDQIAMMKYLDCRDSLYKVTGLQLRPDQQRITSRQFLVTMIYPASELFFWGAGFLLGLFLYNTRVVRGAPRRKPKRRRKRK